MASGCSGDESDLAASPRPQIIVIYSVGGLGDQGYNDCILEGVQRFKKTYYSLTDIYQYSPGSIDEAERLLDDWLSLPESNVPALCVVAASDYEDLVAKKLSERSLTPNKRILMFESENSHNLPITTFSISMYGSSRLAGVTAASMETGNALVMLAYDGEHVITTAEEGFKDGFLSANPHGNVTVEYLADDWTGFISASEAYRRMAQWSEEYDFIFPVAGGSNSGVFRYTRENPNSPLTAGMDVNQWGLSRNITGSAVKRIDLVAEYYLTEWLTSGELPASGTYGLESGYADWILSPYFEDRCREAVEREREKAAKIEMEKINEKK